MDNEEKGRRVCEISFRRLAAILGSWKHLPQDMKIINIQHYPNDHSDGVANPNDLVDFMILAESAEWTSQIEREMCRTNIEMDTEDKGWRVYVMPFKILLLFLAGSTPLPRDTDIVSVRCPKVSPRCLQILLESVEWEREETPEQVYELIQMPDEFKKWVAWGRD
jgi:hypothetical protein